MHCGYFSNKYCSTIYNTGNERHIMSIRYTGKKLPNVYVYMQVKPVNCRYSDSRFLSQCCSETDSRSATKIINASVHGKETIKWAFAKKKKQKQPLHAVSINRQVNREERDTRRLNRTLFDGVVLICLSRGSRDPRSKSLNKLHRFSSVDGRFIVSTTL